MISSIWAHKRQYFALFSKGMGLKTYEGRRG